MYCAAPMKTKMENRESREYGIYEKLKNIYDRSYVQRFTEAHKVREIISEN